MTCCQRAAADCTIDCCDGVKPVKRSATSNEPEGGAAAAVGKSPASGAQPWPPYWKTPASGPPAAAALCRYHVRPGSTAPTPSLPSPSQSPTTGLQPRPPYWKTPPSGLPGAAVGRSSQTRPAVTAPMPSLPSPSQSPTTGVELGGPYWKAPASGAPGVASWCKSQVMLPGSTTPTSSRPS